MATPKVGDLLQRAMPSSPKTIVQMMGFVGESETIVEYPEHIDALAAAGHDPVASRGNLAELRAVAGPLGFRRRLRLQADELGRLSAPTLLVWGRQDGLVPPVYAEEFASRLPQAQTALIDRAGHIPQLEQLDAVRERVLAFLES